MRIMTSVKQNQIDEAVKSLDSDSRDVLMKFIYKGFEVPCKDSSAQLLVWHEKIFNMAGVGSVVRVLVDKRRA